MSISPQPNDRDDETAAQGHIDDLIRGWRGHADLSRRRFMEVERDEALELLDEIERLRRELATREPNQYAMNRRAER